MTSIIILEFIIAFGTPTIALLFSRKVKEQMNGKAIQYFTVQSNIFSSVISGICAIWMLFASEPRWLLFLKYSATCAVAVTFVTVFCYLGPRKRNWKFLLSGPNFWMHLVFPILAIASLILRAPEKLSFAIVPLGLVPVLLYALLYAKKVVFDTPEKRWEDLYGFTKGVSWVKSMIGMFAASFAVSAAIWALLGISWQQL